MRRVLIVDDSIDLGRSLQDALKITYPGISVSVVPSAEEALLVSTRFSFDLLVTDLRLPGMNGLELIRKIRVRQPGILVILMTALMPEDVLVRQKEEVKPDIFIRKPLTASVFLEAVDRLIGDPLPADPPPLEPGVHPASATQASATPASAAQTDPVMSELAAIMPGEPVEPKPERTQKMTGRLNPAPALDPAPEETGLSGLLRELRVRSGALSAILLDERGRLVARAGDLPGGVLEEQLASTVMAALSAGERVSYLLGQTSYQAVQAYKGPDLDLVLAPVGQYALIVALKPGRSALRLALVFEEVLSAQVELGSTLEAMGLRVQSVREGAVPQEILSQIGAPGQPAEPEISPVVLETPLGQDQELEKLEALFLKKNTGQLNLEDPDSFWDSAELKEGDEVSSPGVLSFEQAQKLGLFPPDGEEQRQ